MFDAAGDVLYVGKAKSLKKRVTQYAQGRAHTNAVARMISETAAMEFVTTTTETEALLLESNLIKQLRPRYNVLLRDDKSFPYILLTGDHPAPQIAKHRGARTRKGDYYGPFASAWAVKRTIDALQKAFLLRSCTDSFFENRTRPCLLWQIKRCAGPAPTKFRPRNMTGWRRRPAPFCPAAPTPSRPSSAAACRTRRRRWSSRPPPAIATASPRSRR